MSVNIENVYKIRLQVVSAGFSEAARKKIIDWPVKRK
jgi:hypothetical protein